MWIGDCRNEEGSKAPEEAEVFWSGGEKPRSMPAGEDCRPRSQPPDRSSGFIALRTTGFVCPGHDHQIRNVKAARKLAKITGGESPTRTERAPAVDEDDLQVAINAECLCAVIQNRNRRGRVTTVQRAERCPPIAPVGHTYAGEIPGQSAGLFIEALTRDPGAMTSGEHNRLFRALEQPAAEHPHKRSFAGPTQDQISDADDGYRKPRPPDHSPFERRAPEQRRSSEQERRRDERHSEQPGPEPAGFPTQKGFDAVPDHSPAAGSRLGSRDAAVRASP
jgi:hypothetical protein